MRGSREELFILEVEDLHKQFGSEEVLKGINLKIRQGERRAIIGPNGAGKTTLFNILTGKYKPTKGVVRFKGEKINGLPPFRINRLGMARSFQITNIFQGLSVFENLREAVFSRNKIRLNFWNYAARFKGVNQEVTKQLARINLLNKRDMPAGSLAYGDQRSLEIGIALATVPEVILLDEPTAGMTLDETRVMIEFIKEVTENMTLLIVEHDMKVVFSIADSITVINYGEEIITGSPEMIRQDSRVKEAYLGEQAC